MAAFYFVRGLPIHATREELKKHLSSIMKDIPFKYHIQEKRVLCDGAKDDNFLNEGEIQLGWEVALQVDTSNIPKMILAVQGTLFKFVFHISKKKLFSFVYFRKCMVHPQRATPEEKFHLALKMKEEPNLIHVVGIGPKTSKDTILACFRGVGPCTIVRIGVMRGLKEPHRRACIKYLEAAHSDMAEACLNNTTLEGYTLRVRSCSVKPYEPTRAQVCRGPLGEKRRLTIHEGRYWSTCACNCLQTFYVGLGEKTEKVLRDLSCGKCHGEHEEADIQCCGSGGHFICEICRRNYNTCPWCKAAFPKKALM